MIGLLLGLLGTCSSFILLILDNKDKTSSTRRIVYSIAAIGFFTLLGQQYASHVSSEASSKIIEEIRQDAKDTKEKVSALQVILSNVEAVGIDRFGVEIFPVFTDSMRSFDKGSIFQWEEYAALISNSDMQTALNIYLNDSNNYSPSLLLAYLITNQENRSSLEEKLYNFEPIDFNSFLNDYNGDPACDFILFLNSGEGVMYYAKSQDFINELIVQVQMRDIDPSETISGNDLAKFSSVNLSVNGQNSRSIAESMIEQNISHSVNEIEGGVYYISLANMIKLNN